jgi:hypothetical protein
MKTTKRRFSFLVGDIIELLNAIKEILPQNNKDIPIKKKNSVLVVL